MWTPAPRLTTRPGTDECSREPTGSTRPPVPPHTPPATRPRETSLAAAVARARQQPEEQTDETDEFEGADIQGLVQLVPPYMADAISKYKPNDTLKAAVMMLFPERDSGAPCSIMFEIVDQKVEFLAGKLFNAHLERDGTARLLYYSDDARRGQIASGFTLMCCTAEAIPTLFGTLITVGNLASPHRQKEATGGSRAITKTVTMELRSVGEGARITLSLGREEASQIFKMLFPR